MVEWLLQFMINVGFRFVSVAICVLTMMVFASASVSHFNAPQTVARVSCPWVGYVVLSESLGPKSGAQEL